MSVVASPSRSFDAAMSDWTPVGAAVLVFAVVLFAPQVLNDGDSWWHLAAGEWMIRHGYVPAVDPFAAGEPRLPWVAHEWLAEVVMALAHRAAGWSGIVGVAAAAAGGAFFLLARHLAKALGGPALIVVLVMVFGLVSGSLLARPHLMALPLVVAWVSGLLAARDANRKPSWLLLPLMLVWANLHASFVFGLALIAPFALEALLSAKASQRLGALRDWGPFGLAAALAAVVTPHGIEGLLYPVQVQRMTTLNLIAEWRPTEFTGLQPFEIALLCLLGVALSRPLRLPWLRLVLLLGLLHMALVHSRHQFLFGIVGAMILAGPLAVALASPAAVSLSARFRLPAGAPVVLAILGLALLGLRLSFPIVRVDGATAPLSALAATPPDLRSRPVLNNYGFGGYLIWNGVAPFIDGRGDMYGDALMALQDRISSGDPAALDRTIAERGIQWTIFAPGEPVVALLDAKPGWRRIHEDRYAVVHRRVDTPAGPPARP